MSELLYSARWAGPSFIEQGKDQSVSVAVERDGSPVTLASGTLSLYRPDGSLLVDGVAGSVVGGVFTSATISAASTASETLGKSWLVKVDVVIGGATITLYNDAVMCLARLYPPIGQTDLLTRHSEAAALNSGSNLQGYIDTAWGLITGRLYRKGVPYWKWRTPTALAEALTAQALALMFTDYATLMNQNDRYLKLAESYHRAAKGEVEQLQSLIDESETNNLSDEAVPAAAVVMLSGGARRRRR